MRTALGLTMLAAGIIAIRSAFAPNPDPRVVLGKLFGFDTSNIRLINDPGPSFGPTSGTLSPDNLRRVVERAPSRRDPNQLGRTR